MSDRFIKTAKKTRLFVDTVGYSRCCKAGFVVIFLAMAGKGQPFVSCDPNMGIIVLYYYIIKIVTALFKYFDLEMI